MARESANPWWRRAATAVCAFGAACVFLIVFNVEVPDEVGPLLLLAPLLAITVAGFYVRSRILKVLCFVPATWIIIELISTGF